MSGRLTDVLVIGGGPAGTTAAFQLASAGVAVTLVDRAHFPREKVCGESLSPGALARLRAIGMWEPSEGCGSPAVSPASFQVKGMRIRSPRGATFMGRYKGGPDGTGLAMRRTLLDHELLERARARGVNIVEGVEAIRGEAEADGSAVVTVRDRAGVHTRSLRAQRVVVADGRQSFLGRQLGFIQPGTADSGPKRFAVRAHCDGVSGLSDMAEMQVGQGGYCGIAPLSDTKANVCYVLFGSRINLAPGTLVADFRRHIKAFPDVADRLEHSRIEGAIRVIGPLRVRSPQQTSGPFIACGDTTGFLDPFTGEGIAHAIATGVLAAAATRSSLIGNVRAFDEYARQVRALRRVKGFAASFLYGLVARPHLANSAALVFARLPRLGDAAVRLFGDQI